MADKGYEELIAELSGNRFVQVHHWLLRSLDGDGSLAITLAYILNLLWMRLKPGCKDRKKVTKSGYWIRCPMKELTLNLGIKKRRRERCVKELLQRGVMHTKKGKGFVQYIKVSKDWLENVLLTAKSERVQNVHAAKSERVQNVPASGYGGVPAHTRRNPTKNNSVSLTGQRETFSSNGHHSRNGAASAYKSDEESKEARSAERCARLLHEKIKEEKKLQKSTLPFGQWPNRMLKMFKKYSRPRVKRVIHWWIEHFGEKYTPVVLSITSFEDKFLRIEDRMESKPNGQPETNPEVW